ncbi:MAG TPA: hypothetical protein VK444_07600, partial [Methanobacteriaceae archaeon]|nr:hypothetical protein [Methanobacteriaceae archaeon]
KINCSGVFVDMDNRNGFSNCFAPRITGTSHTEDQLTMMPNHTYNITHERDDNGNHFIVIRPTI